jgi:hypothetical protein
MTDRGLLLQRALEQAVNADKQLFGAVVGVCDQSAEYRWLGAAGVHGERVNPTFLSGGINPTLPYCAYNRIARY